MPGGGRFCPCTRWHGHTAAGDLGYGAASGEVLHGFWVADDFGNSKMHDAKNRGEGGRPQAGQIRVPMY